MTNRLRPVVSGALLKLKGNPRALERMAEPPYTSGSVDESASFGIPPSPCAKAGRSPFWPRLLKANPQRHCATTEKVR